MERRVESAASAGARLGAALAVTGFIGYYAFDIARDPGLASPWAAAWLWAVSLAWIVVTVAILRIRLDLGDACYRIRPFERSGRLYRALGVHQALKLMPHGEYLNRLVRSFRPGSGPISGRQSVLRWAGETRSKEAGHLCHLVLTLPALAIFAGSGWLGSVVAVVVLDVVADLYPVMGQRYNRIRIEGMLRRPGRARPGATQPGG